MVIVDYNALDNNQWLLDWFKTYALTTKKNKINNYLINVSSMNREHTAINSNSILHVKAKDNNILELQGLLEHFINKLTTIK
jgi:hypothetical protein